MQNMKVDVAWVELVSVYTHGAPYLTINKKHHLSTLIALTTLSSLKQHCGPNNRT